MSGEFRTSFVDIGGDEIYLGLEKDGWLTIADLSSEFAHLWIDPVSVYTFIAAVKELETYLTNNQK